MSEEILLKVKNIKKSYGEIEALKGIDLEVKKGEVVVILGPSGCGKSTFLRCLNGLEDVTEGEIILNNYGILGKEVEFEKVRGTIGMVFQSYELFPHMNVINNILLGPTKAQNIRPKIEIKKRLKNKQMNF